MKPIAKEIKEAIDKYFSPISSDNIFTVVDKKNTDDLLVDVDFVKGKKKDDAAGERLIRKYITDDFIAPLADKYKDDNVILLSVPSTSKTNTIPVQLGNVLKEKLNAKGCNTNTLESDNFIDTLHSIAMKDVTKALRPYASRLYEIGDNDTFSALKIASKDCKIVLVEDILTTGASLNAFKNFLKKNGIETDSVIAVKGSNNIYPNQQEIAKAVKLFKDYDMDENRACELCSTFTSSELWAVSTEFSTARKEMQKEPSEKKLEELKYTLDMLYEGRIKGDEDAAFWLQKKVEVETKEAARKKAEKAEAKTKNKIEFSNKSDVDKKDNTLNIINHLKGAVNG